jgi:xanthine/uracil permease
VACGFKLFAFKFNLYRYIVVMKFSVAFGDVKLQQYAIAASLIISGLCTIMNCIQIKIPGTKFVIGTGMLSVIGTSFGFLPIFENAIAAMKDDGVDPMDAYGKMLGTTMVCCLIEVVLAFMPKVGRPYTFCVCGWNYKNFLPCSTHPRTQQHKLNPVESHSA